MRKTIVFAVVVLCLVPVVADAQSLKTEVQGFGGMTVGTSTFGSV